MASMANTIQTLGRELRGLAGMHREQGRGAAAMAAILLPLRKTQLGIVGRVARRVFDPPSDSLPFAGWHPVAGAASARRARRLG
jgi:hypothetical protein